MAMAHSGVLSLGQFILFLAFLLVYMAVVIGLITRMVKRSMAKARESQ